MGMITKSGHRGQLVEFLGPQPGQHAGQHPQDQRGRRRNRRWPGVGDLQARARQHADDQGGHRPDHHAARRRAQCEADGHLLQRRQRRGQEVGRVRPIILAWIRRRGELAKALFRIAIMIRPGATKWPKVTPPTAGPLSAQGDHEDQHIEQRGDHRRGDRLGPDLPEAADFALIERDEPRPVPAVVVARLRRNDAVGHVSHDRSMPCECLACAPWKACSASLGLTMNQHLVSVDRVDGAHCAF
jgi:hypothetical protein